MCSRVEVAFYHYSANILKLIVKIMSQNHLIKLKSTKSKHMYWTRKKKRADKPEKLKLKKFDPNVGKHVIYEESKK